MGARSGAQFLQGLRGTKRQLWLEGERVDDVTAHPALAGAAQTLAGVFDRLLAFPDECLTPDPQTGEPLNIGHLIPRSVRHWRASNLARRQFLEQNLHHTVGSTGMLIFVCEAERYVEILVDEGISKRLDNKNWDGIVAAFTQQVKQGQTLQGFVTCVEACGELLKVHVPVTHVRNELPNRLVVLG